MPNATENSRAAKTPAKSERLESFSTAGYNMVKRDPPEHVTFSDGDFVDGVLLRIDRVRIQGKPAVKYLIRECDSNKRKTFLGLTNIDNQIDMRDVGHRIAVNCTGSTPARIQGQQAMKNFDVLVSDKKVEDVLQPIEGGPITDDDLPPAEAY